MYARETGSVATPIGAVWVTADEHWITAVSISEEPAQPSAAPRSALIREALHQLESYFAGHTRAFDLPLAPAPTERGGALRRAIQDIGFGQVATYGNLARAVGSSARAIGQACARNPLPIVVPCHRVLASDGAGSYSAGQGLATKHWLLNFESSQPSLFS